MDLPKSGCVSIDGLDGTLELEVAAGGPSEGVVFKLPNVEENPLLEDPVVSVFVAVNPLDFPKPKLVWDVPAPKPPDPNEGFVAVDAGAAVLAELPNLKDDVEEIDGLRF